MKLNTCVLGVAGLSQAVAAQTVVNGNFESGLSGWSVTNTVNGVGAPGTTSSVDIDGGGPLGVSSAATFLVGLAVFQLNAFGGIEMTQQINVPAAGGYIISFDWSAQRLAEVINGEGGIFAVIVNGVEVGSVAAGEVTNSAPKYGHFTVNWNAAAASTYTIGLRITRPYVSPGELYQYVDNFTMVQAGGACYPNCDGSTAPPILNALDFTCFLSKFAAGDTYTNCDNSTAPPVLNALDFTCFLSKFAAGCT